MLNGTVAETVIDRYYVLIVDSCDVVISVAGMLPKLGNLPANCCTPDAYKLHVQVALPRNYHRFNIMAVKDSIVAVNFPKFIVQGGLSSGPIVDAKGKAVTNSAPTSHLKMYGTVVLLIASLLFSSRIEHAQ